MGKLLKQQLFSVKHPIGKVCQPVAEDDHAGLWGDVLLMGQVIVTIHEEPDVGMPGDDLFGMRYEARPDKPEVTVGLYFLFHLVGVTAAARPEQRQGDAQVGMEPTEKPLVKAVGKYFFDELVPVIAGA